MNQKQRVFIYDRKEMGILTLLGVMVAVFAFTLGVHLGKKVGGTTKAANPAAETAPVATVNDQVPEPREISEQAKGAEQAATDALRETLEDEVEKTGVKTEKPVQVELPRKPKTENAGATTLQGIKRVAETVHANKTTAARFSLQIGSYPTTAEAQSRVASIAKIGLKPFFKEADLKGKGRWYRVYLGEYSTKAEAERAGQKFRSEQVIDSFIVAKVAQND
jgi:cell division protein FtsN